jgi:hypothetical protein
MLWKRSRPPVEAGQMTGFKDGWMRAEKRVADTSLSFSPIARPERFLDSKLSPRASGYYLFARVGRFSHLPPPAETKAGRGCSLRVNMRIFQASPSRT